MQAPNPFSLDPPSTFAPFLYPLPLPFSPTPLSLPPRPLLLSLLCLLTLLPLTFAPLPPLSFALPLAACGATGSRVRVPPPRAPARTYCCSPSFRLPLQPTSSPSAMLPSYDVTRLRPSDWSWLSASPLLFCCSSVTPPAHLCLPTPPQGFRTFSPSSIFTCTFLPLPS
ncbi:hypothetical protein FKM82_028392 [Ascaphus truei]